MGTMMSRSRLTVRLALVAILAVGLICVGLGAGLGGPEFRVASASDTVGMLSPTRLTALPNRIVTNGTAPLRVRFSGVPATFSPAPVLSPAVPGTWTKRGDSEYFTPSVGLEPCSTYTLSISATSTTKGHSPLGVPQKLALKVACPSVLGLQQTLARLGYLPYEPARGAPTTSRAQLAAQDAFDPPRGALHPRFGGVPALAPGEIDGTTKGALMVFQSEHGIESTGEPESATWKALFSADVHDQRNPDPYTWVTVTESLPETLEVHRDRHVVFSTPANTGVPGAETAQGIFPIFSRFESTTMTGTDVDGTKYTVPDVPWVNYFNGGDAVHGYPRASYGFPQSNGCVELPIEAAAQVYPMLKIGDIVEVS
jgi:peptidoglycan hydrolase-like protein with peptidoglycan-binding domain